MQNKVKRVPGTQLRCYSPLHGRYVTATVDLKGNLYIISPTEIEPKDYSKENSPEQMNKK